MKRPWVSLEHFCPSSTSVYSIFLYVYTEWWHAARNESPDLLLKPTTKEGAQWNHHDKANWSATCLAFVFAPNRWHYIAEGWYTQASIRSAKWRVHQIWPHSKLGCQKFWSWRIWSLPDTRDLWRCNCDRYPEMGTKLIIETCTCKWKWWHEARNESPDLLRKPTAKERAQWNHHDKRIGQRLA